MTFLKVVEGSEIYIFPIHHLLHFYSNFWRFPRSNRGTVKYVRAGRRRAAPASLFGPHADRGAARLPKAQRAPRRLELGAVPRVAYRVAARAHSRDRRSVRRSSSREHPENAVVGPLVTSRHASTIKRPPLPIPRMPSHPSPLCPARAPPSEAAAASTTAGPSQCPTEAFSTSSCT
jgi:hypothetical protein